MLVGGVVSIVVSIYNGHEKMDFFLEMRDIL
jgi:hypothetical protein